MKTMKSYLYVCMCSLMMIAGCGSGGSGSIDITLNIDALSSGEQSAIENFVFIVSDQSEGSDTSVFYPSNCLSSSSGSTCLEQGCGFETDLDVFDPGLSFDDFPEGSTVRVLACGLNAASSNVAAGTSTVTNEDGQSTTINMSSTNSCTGIPAICP